MGLQSNHTLQQIKTILVQVLSVGGHRDTLPLREGSFEVWQFECSWPVILIRGTLHLEDLEDLVDFRVASEECFSLRHFCENTSDRPNIDRSGILFLTEQDLWCSVPESDNFMSVSLDWETKGSSQSEICQLNVTVLVNEQVLRFEVSVHDSVSVAVGSSLQNLVGKLLDFMRREGTTDLSDVLLQIEVAVLEDQIEFVLCVDHFLQPIRWGISKIQK